MYVALTICARIFFIVVYTRQFMPSSSNFNYNIVAAEYTELGDVAPVPTPDLCFEFPVLVKLPTTTTNHHVSSSSSQQKLKQQQQNGRLEKY